MIIMIRFDASINIEDTVFLTKYNTYHIRMSEYRKSKVPSLSQFRDDNKKLHPCLVDFMNLPEPERNYNLQMSAETLK